MKVPLATIAFVAVLAVGQPAAAATATWAEEFLAFCANNRPDMWPAIAQAKAAGYEDLATGPRPGYESFAVVRKGKQGSLRVLSAGTQVTSAPDERVSHCRLEATDTSTVGDKLIRDWVGLPAATDKDGMTEFFFAEGRDGRRIFVTNENFKQSLATYGGISLLTIERKGDRVEAIFTHLFRRR